MLTTNCLAMDFGGSSGRGVLGAFDGERLSIQEVHRFDNYFVNYNGTYYWDVFRLYHKILNTVQIAETTGIRGSLASIGIDTWGTDYGLLDRNGQLLGGVRCMRNADSRIVQEVSDFIGAEELFSRTALQTIPGNTIFQLYERVKERDGALEGANRMLMLPDLMGYFLTGTMLEEYTMVTTSMCYSHTKKNWDFELLQKLNIPPELFCAIHYAGREIFPVWKDLQDELGIAGLSYIPVATHDTASAVVAAPLEKDELFCSSGTWSLFGMESESVWNNEKVRIANFSNEGTADGKIRLLKNIMGMWLIQECAREWRKKGMWLDWPAIVAEAQKVPLFESFLDTEQPELYNAGHMIEKIQAYCRRTGQKIPFEVGEIACCIYQSIAMQYRYTRDQLEQITGKKFRALRIVGGGCKNELLNQFTANVLGIPVYCGPVEAASMGNLLMQYMAAGEVKDFSELREIVKKSDTFKAFFPMEKNCWEDAYQKYCNITGKGQ